MIETCKIIREIYNPDCTNLHLFTAKDSITAANETRGHSRKTFHKRPRLNLRIPCFTNSVALWSSLHANIVETTSLNSFEKGF